jgi:hypothetical protein
MFNFLGICAMALTTKLRGSVLHADQIADDLV